MMNPVAWLAAIDPATWFSDIIGRLLDLVVWPLFAGLSVIMFIWAGVLFITAQGDPSRVSNAKKALIWAVIGVAVGLSALSISFVIKKILGPL